MLRVIFICFVGAAFTSLAVAGPTSVRDEMLAPAIHEMCAKKIVFLGEDANHAAAQTIAVKAQLVEALVQQCGFRGVVFESQFYDMVDFQHSLDAGTATEAQLSSAIGALWSRYPVFQSFETWLFGQVSTKHLLVAGVDPQVGGIGARYSPSKLPQALASVLDGDDRRLCQEAMTRHNGWTYDDAHPFDDAAFDTLEKCACKVSVTLSARERQAPDSLVAMASSSLAYVDSIHPHGGKQGARDHAMYQNLLWVLSQWPADTRVVVWTASVHASKMPIAGTDHGAPTFGSYVHSAEGDHAYALGFSAVGGRYGSVGGHGAVHELAPPPQGSLEASAFSPGDNHDVAHFLSSNALQQVGVVPGRAFNYGRFQTRRWSDYLDGVVVLRTETAATASP